MNRYEEVEKLVLSLKEEFHKFYEKDNKAAGTRVRKGMQELKKNRTRNSSQRARCQSK